MLPNRLLRWDFVLIWLFLAFSSRGVILAQEPAAPPAGAADPAADGAPSDDAADEAPLREQTIYVPYEKLREVFEKEGRGVFLPHDKFQKLWEAARRQTAPPEKERPPVGAMIAQADSEATVERDVVSVVARLKIEVLAEGWHEVPIRLADAAIQSATTGGQPARVVPGKDGYKLLVKNENREPRELEVQLEYVKTFAKAPGQNSVAFQAPQAPVNRWTIRIPEAGVKVNISPMIAATEVPSDAEDDEADPAPAEAPADEGAPGDDDPAAAQETVVLAFVGAAPEVRIDWTPKSEGATGLAALATVQSEQEVRIDEGVMRTRARLVYDISRADLARLSIQVPADQKVVNVFDANVRQWDVTADGEQQTIDVQLFEPTRGTQKLQVDLERFSDNLLADDLVVPTIKALDAGRQQGIVVVALAPGLQAEAAQSDGLLQVDRPELPEHLQRESWAFAFRYAALPFDLVLKAEKVQPKIRTDELVEAYLEPEQLSLSHSTMFTIERAGVFQLRLQVPAGFEVREVRGLEIAGAEAAAVDSHQLSGGIETPADETQEDETQEGESPVGPSRLEVNLSKKAFGKVGLIVELERRLDDPNLLSPTGEASQIDIDIPRVDPADIQQCLGRLVVYKPDSLRIVPTEQEGVSDAVSLEGAFTKLPSARGNRFATTRPSLPFAYTEQPASLTLSVQRRKPHVTARQLLVARIEAGVVKYDATFVFDILYSGVKSLRIDVPDDVAPEITNRTERIQEQEFDPTTEGGPEPPANHVAWRLTGETELIGQVKVEFSWERKLSGELAVGKPQPVPLPHLRPQGVDRAWGQVVIAKAETIDVRPVGEPEGLRMIDPQQDLDPDAQVGDAALAFEFHDDWNLQINATRYELTKVKRTSIERAVVRIAATLDGELIVQALYRLRSARQRLAVQLPNSQEVDFDSQPLSINGQPVSLEEGDGDAYFIPMVGQDPDEPLLLELRYTVPGGPGLLELPFFPDEPPVAVQKVFLCVYLPERRVLLASKGPWTDEMAWVYRWPLRARAYAQCPEVIAMRREMGQHLLPDDRALVHWVSQDVSVSGDVFDRLPVQGTPYIYSTLRPAPPPDSALRLSTINRNMLSWLVFIIVGAVGLLMLKRPYYEKFAALAAIAITLILCGVFLPTLAVQILGTSFIVAVIIVLIVWLVGWAFFLSRATGGLLPALLRGRQPRDVVVREITPPPSSSPSAALGQAPDLPPEESDEADEKTDEPAKEATDEKKDEPADEKKDEKTDSEASSDDEGNKPEGGQNDA